MLIHLIRCNTNSSRLLQSSLFQPFGLTTDLRVPASNHRLCSFTEATLLRVPKRCGPFSPSFAFLPWKSLPAFLRASFRLIALVRLDTQQSVVTPSCVSSSPHLNPQVIVEGSEAQHANASSPPGLMGGPCGDRRRSSPREGNQQCPSHYF